MSRKRKAPCMGCPFRKENLAGFQHTFASFELQDTLKALQDPAGEMDCHMMQGKECFGWSAFRTGDRPREVDHPSLFGSISELKVGT